MGRNIKSGECAQADYASYALRLRDGILDVLERPIEPRPRSPRQVRRTPSLDVYPCPVVTPVKSAPALGFVHHYSIGGQQITYSASSKDLLDLVDGLWSPFRSLERSVNGLQIGAWRQESGYTLRTSNSGDSHLFSELQLKGGIQRAIVEALYAQNDWLAVLHAGAVSRGGEALGLLGSTRAGKSTLIAGLTRSGFDYFSDDCVPVSCADLRAFSVPTALSLREGSWDVLAGRIPELAAIKPSRRGQDRIKHWFPAEQAPSVLRRQPLRWLIHPHYAPLQSPSVRKLESLEALQNFVASGSSPGRNVDSTHLQRFASWLEGLEHYSISYRSLDEAVSQVSSIVGS